MCALVQDLELARFMKEQEEAQKVWGHAGGGTGNVGRCT